MSDRDSLDLFLGDMAGHQAVHVGETTPGQNHAMAAALFEQMDQRQAEESRRFTPQPVADPMPEVRASDVEAAKRGYKFDRRPELPLVAKPLTPAEQVIAAATRRRIDLLLSKQESGPLGQPSWAMRLRAVLAGQLHDPRTKTQVAREVNALIEESELVFGSIFAEAPRKAFLI